MDEYIFAICTRNKSKALSSVEPFDCSFFHGTNPFLKSYPDQPSGRCTLLIPTLAKNINEHWCQLVDVRWLLHIPAMQNFVHQKIIEAVSFIQMYSGFLTKKQARCTVTWHAYNTYCSYKFQEEKHFPALLSRYHTCSSMEIEWVYLNGNCSIFDTVFLAYEKLVIIWSLAYLRIYYYVLLWFFIYNGKKIVLHVLISIRVTVMVLGNLLFVKYNPLICNDLILGNVKNDSRST
jgi:hypothetical protein